VSLCRARGEVDTEIQSLTSIIEPILMIGVGAMVGTIVIAMYMPMFKMLELIKWSPPLFSRLFSNRTR
jgi:type II secretory pathway component PulF